MKLEFKFRTTHPVFTYKEDATYPWIWIPKTDSQLRDFELANFIVFQEKPTYWDTPWVLYTLRKL